MKEIDIQKYNWDMEWTTWNIRPIQHLQNICIRSQNWWKKMPHIVSVLLDDE